MAEPTWILACFAVKELQYAIQNNVSALKEKTNSPTATASADWLGSSFTSTPHDLSPKIPYSASDAKTAWR